jgi:excisionase family DNA binding protein
MFPVVELRVRFCGELLIKFVFNFLVPPSLLCWEIPVGPEDAARLLRMHPKTVIRKTREGTLPAHPVGRDRKRWHFYLSELDDWLRSQVTTTSPVRRRSQAEPSGCRSLSR